MNNKYKSILKLIIFCVLLLMLFNVNVYAKETEMGEYSKRYLEWLELPEKQKNETIPPFSYNIRKNADTGFLKKFRNTMKSISIPSSYDLRDDIYIEVKNQEDTGECWAFSANTSLETYLALNGEDYNFSERHLEYSTASNFKDGVNPYALNRLVGDGGYISTAFTYYSRGSGPILEEDMPFENNEYTISINNLPNNASVKKVDNMIYFSNIYKTRENGELKYIDANNNEYTKVEINDIRNQIKEHIMKFGAVSANVYAPSIHYNENTCADNLCENAYSNHTVTIIGWDDKYKKENFNSQPSDDGAYIVLNSWGSEWGDNGVYYVSYEDFLIESEVRGVTSVSNIEYDHLYQHDISEMGNYIKSQYAANVFSAEGNEKLTEIMIGSLSDQICDIYINTENTNLDINNLTKIASNVELKPGYNTIKIDSNIYLSSENNFAIVVKLINSDYTGIGIEDNNMIPFGNAISKQGESFVSEDGIIWNDIYDENNMINLSIKVYTQTEESNVEIIDIKYPNKLLFENLGGNIILKLKTSIDYEGTEFNVQIFDDLENEITSQFNIDSNIIKDKQGRVNILVSNEVKAGKYSIKILNDTMIVAETDILVREQYDTDIYMKVKFRDENLYNALKNNVLSDNDVYAYFDENQELIVRKDIDSIDLEGTVVRADGIVRFGKGYKVSNLSGLEHFTSLRQLVLSSNPIEDLKPIENLTNLEDLQLYYGMLVFEGIGYKNEIKNIEVIGNLTKLERLELTNSEIEDLTFLENLKELRSLDLQQNKISDISPLKNLTNLNYLCLGSNKISDISYLENLTNLNRLILQDNQIKDISVIKNLTNLIVLYLNMNKIADATILDSESLKDKKWEEFLFYNNIIEHQIEHIEEDFVIIELPKVLQQTFENKSILYSTDGVELNYCEWNEYGKNIKINVSESDHCSIRVVSGNAINTIFEVEIDIDKIEIVTLPSKLNYCKGDKLNLAGGVVKLSTKDGSSTNINMKNLDFEIYGYDKEKIGEQTVELRYKGKSATFDVTVVEEVAENCKISISTEPRKTVYIKGETLDLQGGYIAVEEKDIAYIVSMNDSRITVEGFDSNKLGEQIITINFKGQKVTFKVIVKNDVISISISNLPKTRYIKGEELDLSNGKILVTYEDGSTEEKLMTEDVTVIGFDNSILGEQTITLTYLNTTTTFVVNIICEHTYEGWNIVKKATCEEAGERERICSICQNKDTETIEKLGHVYSEEWIIDKQATYEEDGHKYRKCLNCNVEKEEQVIPKLTKEELKVTTIYDIKEIENTRYIMILPGARVSEVLGNITANKEIKVVDKLGKDLKSNDLVGTGAKVVTKEDNRDIYVVVTKGDADGDAEIDFIKDIIRFNNYRLKLISLDTASILAGDINQDGIIDFIKDIIRINNYRLGIINSL